MQAIISQAPIKPQEPVVRFYSGGITLYFIIHLPLQFVLVSEQSRDKADTWAVNCIQLSHRVIMKTLCSEWVPINMKDSLINIKHEDLQEGTELDINKSVI